MMAHIPSFNEQMSIVRGTLDNDLQVRMLSQEIGDGACLGNDACPAHRVTVLAGLIFALKGSYADFAEPINPAQEPIADLKHLTDLFRQ